MTYLETAQTITALAGIACIQIGSGWLKRYLKSIRYS